MDYIFSFLKNLEYEKRYSRNTVESYRIDLLQFQEFCFREAGLQVHLVDAVLIRGWIVSCVENELSNRSVNRKISTLKSFFKFLMKEGVVQKNPLAKVESLKNRKRLPVFVTGNQMERLFDDVAFGMDFSGCRNRLILEIFYGTGIRLSELLNIQVNDFDRAGLTLKVLGKRDRERIIPVPVILAKSVDHYLELRNEQFGVSGNDKLFLTDSGQPLYPKFVYRLVTVSLGMVTTLDRRSPHVLRHTFATHMLNNGAAISAIKELLGHANLAATQVYTHNSFEKLKNIYKQAHPRA